MRYLVLVLAITCHVGCTTSPQQAKFKDWPKSAKECAARGGNIQSITFSSKGCVFPAKDGGKTCSDSSECEGTCDAPAGSPTGWEGTGLCSARGGPSNSGNILIGGKATGSFVFD